MSDAAVGRPLAALVSLDAVLVLSGAVLTSFVGVNWILVGFFGLCVSILVITGGRIEALAGVYTLAFLSVMALFALGNVLLKYRRERLPRAVS